MVRLRFHASWLPEDHDHFWTIIDCTTNIKTIHDLIEYFNEQQKSLANYYQFHLSKRSTKLKYLKAFVSNCVLPPFAQADQILRDNDQVDFRLEIDAQNEWLLVKSPPSLKRKRSIEDEILPSNDVDNILPSNALESITFTTADLDNIPPSTTDLDNILRSIAQTSRTTNSPENTSFTFQFGNKRGRPIPPRPPVMSSVAVNSLVPRQVIKNRK